MEVLVTIVPIFAIIILGWVARRRGFITAEFLEPANRLVYYLSLPVLIFNSIAKARFHEQFDAHVLALTLLAAALVYLVSYLLARLTKMPPARIGPFVQGSGHGNLGYIGLPIALYYLGEPGLAKAGIISGFLMILQNLLSVVALQMHDTTTSKRPGIKSFAKKLLGNPVIFGAMAGVVVSFLAVPIPQVILRCFDILGGLAPPTALLLIGASLSVQLIRTHQRPALGAVCLKLVLLPAIGLLLFSLFHLAATDYLPAIILLCSPTATVAYVMAREMHGDTEVAVATISASTLLSSATFVFWLALVAAL
ncbi:MAG: AEC family transporter [Desulforhopalus sp.]|nr:AEC family transporter [Desulforhopalus sp.]